MKIEPNQELGDFLETKSGNYKTNGKILNKELTIVLLRENYHTTPTQVSERNLGEVWSRNGHKNHLESQEMGATVLRAQGKNGGLRGHELGGVN